MLVQRNTRNLLATTSNCNTHIIHFSGKEIETVVRNRAPVAEEWVREIYSRHNGTRIIVGFDVKGIYSFGCPGTMQLCVDTKCLILQLAHMDNIPQAFKYFISDPNVLCACVNLDAFKCSSYKYSTFKSSSPIEVLELAPRSYASSVRSAIGVKPQLEDLARHIERLNIEKPGFVQNGDWGARVLMVEQIKCATIDAYATYRIDLKLLLQNV